MADELLDLVNEKDEIIGEVWKSEANQNPKLYHREIAVIVYDGKYRILFQKRSLLKKVNPGYWTVTVAGHPDKGEDLLEAAHRELKEELGFDTDLEFFEKDLGHDSNETHFVYWYKGKFPEDAKITLQKEEVEAAMFISRKDVERIEKSDDPNKIKLGAQSINMVKKFWKTRGLG